MIIQTHKTRARNKVRWTLELNRATFKRYVVMFLFIFVFASPLFSFTLKSLFLVIALVMILINKPSLSKRKANWIVIAVIFFTPAILIDGYFLTQYSFLSFAGFAIISMVIFAIVIAHRIEEFSTLLAYANLVTALTLLSVISFILVMISPSILTYAFQYEYYGYPGLSLGLQNFVMSNGIVVFRNAGFASEPGVFQVFINISVSIFFHAKKMNLPRFLILAAGITTANSTAGLVTFVAIVFFASNARYRIVALLAFFVASSKIMSIALTHYESKILTEYAFMGRLEPILNALDIIKQYPLGFGTVRYDQFIEILHIGSHDGYTQALMRFGILGFLFFVGSLVRLARRQRGIALAIALGSVTNNLLAIPAVAFFLFIDWKRLHATTQSKSSTTPT